MNKKNPLTTADKAFIFVYANKITVQQIAEQLGRTEATIYGYLYKHKIDFKKAIKRKPKGPYRTITRNIITYSTFEPSKKSFNRPPAIYSNRSPFGIAKG